MTATDGPPACPRGRARARPRRTTATSAGATRRGARVGPAARRVRGAARCAARAGSRRSIGRSSARPIDVDVRTVVAPAGRRSSSRRPDRIAERPDARRCARARGVHAHLPRVGPAALAAPRPRSGPPLPPRLRRVTLGARDVPERLDLRLAPGSERGRVRPRRARSASCGSSRPTAAARCRRFADGADGLYYRDLRSRFAVRAQLTGLQRIAYTASPLAVTVARPGGAPRPAGPPDARRSARGRARPPARRCGGCGREARRAAGGSARSRCACRAASTGCPASCG